MPKIFRQYGIFFILPGVVLIFTLLLKLATGPFWLAPNFDPAYQYCINGLYLIKGLVPNHTDHPGTPLQILCCVVYWLTNLGQPAEVIVIRVLSNPEFYMRIVFIILSLFTFLTSVLLAVYVFRKTNDRLAALLTTLPMLSFLVLKSWETSQPVLPVVANLDPETMMIGVLNLFNIFLLMNFFAKTPKDGVVSTVMWGLMSGLGVAVKLTFLPILAVPFLILSWKNKIIFGFVCAVSFFVWTLPILSKYPIIVGWITGIALHKGAYGGGGQGLTEIFNDILNWKTIIVQHWAFACLMLVALALIVGKLVQKKWDRGTAFLSATLAGIVIQFSAVTQHPGAHYLLPGLGLFSALLVLLYLQAFEPHPLGRRITLIFILFGTVLGIWQAGWYCSKLKSLTTDIISFRQEVLAKYPDAIYIDYYRSSDPQAALFFGDGWNLAPHLGQELFNLYPNKFYYHLWGNRILNFKGQVWSDDLLSADPTVIFRGDENFDFSQSPFQVQLLDQGRFEEAHLLTGTTEKQANFLLAAGMQFFQAGQYAKAMACLMQARQLRYQPQSSLDSMIQLFQTRLQQ